MSEDRCILCGQSATKKSELCNNWHVYRFHCQTSCGHYYVGRTDLEDAFESTKGLPEVDKKKMAALLREQSISDDRIKYLWWREKPTIQENVSIAHVSIDEILRTWPVSILERLDRCLRSLIERANKDGKEFAQGLPSAREQRMRLLSLCTSVDESSAIVKLMDELGWITEKAVSRFDSFVSVLAKGWERYDVLTRGMANRNNPAFVAMWFGGKDDRMRQQQLDNFESVFKAACISAGWTAKRADTDEHNEPIMDRIIADIRQTPFLIADLTENNDGVYYEAGFARGLGRDVIYCCHEETRPHFDISGINHIKYKEPKELRAKLENRILGTVGEGPKYKRERRNEA